MSVRKAAQLVLKEAGGPLHAGEIAKRMISQKLWATDGKTPHATVSARLYADIKKNGDSSPFIQTAPQTFGLRTGVVAKSATPKNDRQESKAKKQTLSFTRAAEHVLERFGDKRPMHYRAITEKAMELDLLETQGQTPEATMYAQILTDINRHRKRGEQSRFIQHGKGFVSLSRWMGHGLAFQIEEQNKKVRDALRKHLLAMKWNDFEELIARLLAEMGFDNIQMTRGSGDGGIDVRGTLVVGNAIRTRMAVQVKKWKHNVQSPVVQQVRGSLGTHEQGLIITTSDFSPGARKEAQRADAIPVGLMNGEQLVLLLVEYGIGVTRRSHDIIELTDGIDSKEAASE